MFGSIGFPELIMIFIVVLLLFGPQKLPDVAKLLGKTIREFRETVNAAKATIEEEIEKADVAKDLKEIDNEIKEAVQMPKPDIYEDIKQIGKDIDEVKETTKIGKN